MKYLTIIAALLAALPAAAAELDGVTMPDTQSVAGTPLVLNGMAVRTYSVLHVHVYVGGLYLDHKSANPDEIIASPAPKAMRFVFSRNIGEKAARDSWRESLDMSCQPPCHLAPESIERFIAAIPAVREGDVSLLLFTNKGLDFFVNGKSMGRVDDQGFVKVILSSFIGPHPSAPEVKRGLLGLQR